MQGERPPRKAVPAEPQQALLSCRPPPPAALHACDAMAAACWERKVAKKQVEGRSDSTASRSAAMSDCKDTWVGGVGSGCHQIQGNFHIAGKQQGQQGLLQDYSMPEAAAVRAQ